MQLLHQSQLCFTSPQKQRPVYFLVSVWVGLVDPKFAFEVLQYLRQAKEQGTSEVNEGDLAAIREDVGRTFVGSLSVLNAPNREKQMVTMLSLFVCKRPDIGYDSGMNYLMAVLLSVFSTESDAFVMFSHIIENVYPTGYFEDTERNLILHRELRVLVLMAERMRPRLVKCLQAIFRTESAPSQSDFSPFVTTIKRIGEVWFSTLFCTMLVPSDLLRVWDVLFVKGFEFAQKFALVLLSRNEKFLRDNIKTEAKALNVGMSVDALIVAGNSTRVRLQKRVEKIPIEQLIKKALVKSSYVSLRRDDFLPAAAQIEGNHIDRLLRLRQTKRLLQSTPLSFSEVLTMFQAFDQIQLNDSVSRALFMTKATKDFKWSALTALNVFTLLDQTGSDALDMRELKAGLAMLFSGTLEEKLRLCFHAFDIDHSGYLEPPEVVDMISIMESTLDGRSSFYRSQSASLYRLMDRNEDNKISVDEFVSSALKDPGAKPILDYINAIDGQDANAADMRMVALFNEEGEFEEIHSAISTMEEGVSGSDMEEEWEKQGTAVESLLESDLKEVSADHEMEEHKPESSPFLFPVLKEPQRSIRLEDGKDLPPMAPTPPTARTTEEHRPEQGEIVGKGHKKERGIVDTAKPKSRNTCERLCGPTSCLIC